MVVVAIPDATYKLGSCVFFVSQLVASVYPKAQPKIPEPYLLFYIKLELRSALRFTRDLLAFFYRQRLLPVV